MDRLRCGMQGGEGRCQGARILEKVTGDRVCSCGRTSREAAATLPPASRSETHLEMRGEVWRGLSPVASVFPAEQKLHAYEGGHEGPGSLNREK